MPSGVDLRQRWCCVLQERGSLKSTGGRDYIFEQIAKALGPSELESADPAHPAPEPPSTTCGSSACSKTRGSRIIAGTLLTS